jgi:hypothetical protein
MDKPKNLNVWETRIVCCAWGFVLLGFVAALLGLMVTWNTPGGFNLTNLGTFGSYLQGSVSSLWALAGLLFIFVTFRAQKRQLAQQEAELEEQKHQSDLQLHSIQLQSFENSFFQLLLMLGQIVNEMKEFKQEAGPDGRSQVQRTVLKVHGRDCFAYWYQLLQAGFTPQKLAELAGVDLPENRELEITARTYFEDFYKHRQSSLGHYFRTLYHLLKFIDSAPVLKTNEDKRRYVNLARAQLSAYELILIFYNGIQPVAANFKKLVEEFGLLEHLDRGLLLNAAHQKFYDQAYH